MRICHVVEAGSGGAAGIVAELATYGAAIGDDVTVVHGPNRLSKQFTQTVGSAGGVKVIRTPMRREIGFHDIIDAWHLYRVLQQGGPFDVIHGHSSKAGALVRILGWLFPAAVKVYTPHAFVTLDPDARAVYGLFERILSWLGDMIIAVSEDERDHGLHCLGIAADRITLITNGAGAKAAVGRGAARWEMGYNDREFVVGFVGRFVAQKNLGKAIATFEATARGRPNLRLALISDDLLPPDLAAALRGRGLTDQVSLFDGFRGCQLMAGLDCLLCASAYEGFPLVFIESLAAGVPIITTPVGGAREAVIEGKTGFVASDFSVDALSDALQKIYSLDVTQRSTLGECCRLHSRRFDVSTMAAATRACYQYLDDRRRQRGA